MEDLSLHILDIAENAIRAGARVVEIRLVEDTATDLLLIEIADDGKGMDAELCRQVLSPFVTTRTERRFGLGLPLLAQAAREANGDCRVESQPGKGTKVVATFSHSHIDRKPIGDLRATYETLVVGNPTVEFVLELWSDGKVQRLDTREFRGAGGAGGTSTARFHEGTAV